MRFCRSVSVFLMLTMFLFSAAAFPQMPGGGMGGGSGSIMGYENRNVNHDLVIPQVAVGQHYVTNLLLLNIGNSQAMTWVTPQNLVTTGKVYFYRQDGTRLLVSINGGTPASEFAFSLDPSKAAYYTVSSKDSDTSGWALVDVDEPATGSGWGMMDGQTMTRGMRLMANVFYTYSGSGQPTSRVGVVPSMYEMGKFATAIISAQSRDDLYTGVAIVNTGANSATVTLRLKDSNGSVLATTPLDIKAGN